MPCFGFCQLNVLIVPESERMLMASELESVEEYQRDPFVDVDVAFKQTILFDVVVLHNFLKPLTGSYF